MFCRFTKRCKLGLGGGSCIVLADRDNNGGPRSRWQLMLDPVASSGQ